MRIMIAVPCMETVHTEFFKSVVAMRLVPGNDYQYATSKSSLIYDARNQLGKLACEGNFDRMLWLDRDMVFQPDLLEKLNARIDEGYDFVSAMYFTRKPPTVPVVYEKVYFEELPDGKKMPKAEPYINYPKDSLFKIAGSGFGAVMMTVSMLKDIAMSCGLPFSPRLGFGEDLTFCQMAIELGYELYCDSSILCGHVGNKIFGEEDYNAASR